MSPDSQSIATNSMRRDGHSCEGSRDSITARRLDSGTVCAASAQAPAWRRISSWEVAPVMYRSNCSPNSAMSISAMISADCRRSLGLPGEQLGEAASAAELRRHRGARGRADDQVGTCHVLAGLGEPGQQPGHPRDPGDTAAAEHQRLVDRHHGSLLTTARTRSGYGPR